LAYAFGLACLVWVFHDIDPRRLLAAMSIGNWWFIVLAIIVDVLTFVLQGLRWKLLLAPVGRLSSLRATQAIYAGLFTNELVPLRFGELVRAFLVSRWLSKPFASVLPSIVVERFLDGVCLTAAIGLAAILVPLPRQFIAAGYTLGCVVLLAAALLLWLVYRRAKGSQRDVRSSPSRLVSGLSRFFSEFASGLRAIGTPQRITFAALLSAGMLTCQVLALWFILLGCRIHLSLLAGAIILLIVRLGTAIPNAPANIGSMQFFTVLALELFGVEKTIAAGFSITYFLVLTIPLWVIGLFAISNAGINIAAIRSEARVLHRDSGYA
jgi:uncharacterized protein (TIRG00374 family)